MSLSVWKYSGSQDHTTSRSNCRYCRISRSSRFIRTTKQKIHAEHIQDCVPAALTKDKKRIHEQEIAVHLAWKSTLYVTNFPESADDAFMRNLFGKVSLFLAPSIFISSSPCLVWNHIRCSLAQQEVQEHKTILLHSIYLTGSDTLSL